ncbi:MAG: AhpC/TSA family protein [Bacteroidales bacterium]|nr:AhpC/TSA family protein [Bacteroidales bacterium]
MPCRAHLGEVATARERLAQAGVDLLVVCQATPAELARFLQREPYSIPIVCDPARTLYQQLGLTRTGFWSFLRLGEIRTYLRLIARGTWPRWPSTGEDVYQLGGDCVLDHMGNVVWAWRSRTATDRPTIAEILRGLPEG